MANKELLSLSVKLALQGEVYRVGELVQSEGKIYFEYDKEFIQRGLEISPFKLPLAQRFFKDISRRELFGLPGVIYDSLPDGWGLLVMDRMFRSQGIDPDTISPLARLAYLGDRAMGALRYEPESDLFSVDDLKPLDLVELARESEMILNGETDTVIRELLIAGGSPGGARPKALVALNPATNQAAYGHTPLLDGFDHFVVKFRGFKEHQDIGAVEYIYSLMAKAAGIDMPDTHLLHCGEQRFFAIKRFDRVREQRMHVHTLAGLLHTDFRMPETSYSHLLKVTSFLTHDHREVVEAFRRMVFNVIAFNRDDHAKNFSFIMNKQGQWRLSPAYDLVYSQGYGGWHTMDIGGTQHPSREQILDLAKQLGVKISSANKVIDQVRDALTQWHDLAEQYEIDKALYNDINKSLNLISRSFDKGACGERQA